MEDTCYTVLLKLLSPGMFDAEFEPTAVYQVVFSHDIATYLCSIQRIGLYMCTILIGVDPARVYGSGTS